MSKLSLAHAVAPGFLSVFFFLLLFSTAPHSGAMASPGDTITVRVQDQVHWNWYGNWDQWAVLPSDTISFRKIIMRYKIGCPASGCSGWDYTTNIQLRQHTGSYDSTFQLAPDFTVDGSLIDTACYSLAQTWVYFFDTVANGTDSIPSTSFWVREFDDLIDPWLQTDSLNVWPANYYNYVFNASGTVVDSIWVGADTCRYLTYDTVWNTPFEVIVPYELGRVITPYAGDRNAGWFYTWYFDVTDFAPLLHDSVEIRAFYGGWQDGFTITVDFDFIEGTPPRNCYQVDPLWYGEFQYGNPANDIENYIVPVRTIMDPMAAGAKVAITTTGHSFGGAQNCAEFCHKFHDVVIEDTTLVQDLWRYDCGNNPLFPQTGTWLYERAGWCPGSYATIHEYEATPWLIAGDTLTVDYNMAPYTYMGGAGFHPNYFVSGLLFHYTGPNFNLDAEVLNVTRPNSDPLFIRNNPTCDNPLIQVRNAGSSPVTSLTISYGVVGGDTQQFVWNGNLSFLQTAEIELPTPIWGTLLPTGNKFEARIIAVNGGLDQNPWNDLYRTTFKSTPLHSGNLYLYWRTNGYPYETKWEILDENNIVMYQSGVFLLPNFIYRDTFLLGPGCYRFRMWDTDGDGLSFFANNDGSGFARLRVLGTNQVVKTFEPDFGVEVDYFFRVDVPTAMEAPQISPNQVTVYPNPARDKVAVDLNLNSRQSVEIEVFSIQGVKLSGESYSGIAQKIVDFDIRNLADGVYFVRIKTTDETFTRKLVIRR